MKKTEEYRKHAKECRALAKQTEPGERKAQLLAMADTWEVIIRERDRNVAGSACPHTPWMTTVVKN